ncbi:MAG: response regulator, partial [Anaerolineaceae bacterium]
MIDDDIVGRTLVQHVLEFRKYRFYAAVDARQGLAMAFEVSPDLILLDLNLPGKDGFDLLHDFRSIPEFMKTPIIMITSSGFEDVVTQAIHDGVNDFLAKPFEIKKLLERIIK